MFYYLLYNSSFAFIENNRLFSSLLYGSILYIVTHAIINYCGIEILTILANYFWFIFILDLLTFIWSLYQILNTSNSHDGSPVNDLKVSFNLLNNKINTFLDRKDNLTITQNIPIPQHPQPTLHQQQQQPTQIHHPPLQQNKSMSNTNKLSTPISEIQKKQQSTPINLIRSGITIPEPNILEYGNINSGSGGSGGISGNDDMNESVAGSDVGSILDLDDFEKTI